MNHFPKYPFIHIDDVEAAAEDLANHAHHFMGRDLPPDDTNQLSHYDSDHPFASTAQTECREDGHDLVDVSSAGPESGDMDHECRRCGEYWSVPLY